MKLTIKNVGKIDKASVEINGITVIAGENNTGKSTIGRALFSVFNSFHNVDEQTRLEREESIENLLDMMYRNVTNRLTSRVDTEEISKMIIEQIDYYKEDREVLKEDIIRAILQYDESFEKFSHNTEIDSAIIRIIDVLEVSDVDVFKSVLEKNLDAEFNAQINNVFTEEDAEVCLEIKEQMVKVTIKDNHVIDVTSQVNLGTEAIYLDDPFILGEPRFRFWGTGQGYLDHRTQLKNKVYGGRKDNNIIEEIVVNNKFENIYSKIASVCSGDIVPNKISGLGYRKANSDKILDIRNVSTGLKTFVILKKLLENGALEYNGTIILDEPEIHLHPEWQLLFAELIVLIQKEFKMHILLNTHSPYFLRALQVYSAKYEIADRCKYYLAEQEGEKAHIQDVSNDIDKIYVKLSYPLQKLEDMRWQDDKDF